MSKTQGTKKSTAKKSKRREPSDTDVIFDTIDLNHDGRISVYELTKAARLLGMNPTKQEAEEMIKECNPSQEGYVSKAEFKKLFQERQQEIENETEQLMAAFRVFDKDNSGTITADEIRAVLTKHGEKADPAEVDEMLRQADVNGDGIISIEEFSALMCE